MAGSILKNAVIRLSGEGVNKALWFLFMIFLARSLGPKEFGFFSYAFSFGSLLAILTDLGTNNYLIKAVHEKPGQDDFYLNSIYGLKIVLSVIAVVVLLIFAFFSVHVDKVVVLFSLSLIVVSFIDPVNYLFRAHKQMGYETLLMLLWRVLLVGSGFAAIYFMKWGLEPLSFLFLAVSFVMVFAAQYLVRKKYKVSFYMTERKGWLDFFKKSVPIGLLIFAGAILLKMNTIILQFFRGGEEVGWYSASFRLIEGTLFIPSFFVAAVFPHFCENFQNGQKSSLGILRKAFILLSASSLLVSACLFVFSKFLIRILYGPDFSPAVASMSVLSASVFFMFINELFLFFFISVNRHAAALKMYFVTVLLYLAACVLTISRWGYMGAAWSLLAAEILLFLLYLVAGNFNKPLFPDRGPAVC